MSHPAITVENLSKAYRLGVKEEVADTLTKALIGVVRAPLRNLNKLRRLTRFAVEDDSPDTLWALRDVSFEVKEGEVVGVIGRNGAGKSTLLKILSRITEPTKGRAVIHGRVSSLLEVGTGFHPELTGRENIYMNGTILGMTKREIDRKFDEIVDFSGVERFLETPIKRYSSGMQVRLAFSVAAHLEPEILIVDEVLAVGDVDFQKKCLGKMHSVADSGRTVLFVSHNMGAVEGLCTRGLVLNKGMLLLDATAANAVKTYHQRSLTSLPGAGHRFQPCNDLRTSASTVVVRELRVSSNGVVLDEGYAVGAPLEFHIECETADELTNPAAYIRIKSSSGQVVTELHSRRCGGRLGGRLHGRFIISCVVPELLLYPGEYNLEVAFEAHGRWLFSADCAGRLNILPTDFFGTGKGASIPNVLVICRQQWTSRVGAQNGARPLACEPKTESDAAALDSREAGHSL